MWLTWLCYMSVACRLPSLDQVVRPILTPTELAKLTQKSSRRTKILAHDFFHAYLSIFVKMKIKSESKFHSRSKYPTIPSRTIISLDQSQMKIFINLSSTGLWGTSSIISQVVDSILFQGFSSVVQMKMITFLTSIERGRRRDAAVVKQASGPIFNLLTRFSNCLCHLTSI